MRTRTIRPSRVQNLVSAIFDDDLKAKRVASLGNAVGGALVGARPAVATLGRALAIAKRRNPKHAIKQVDRFFSNTGVDVWHLSSPPGFRSSWGRALVLDGVEAAIHASTPLFVTGCTEAVLTV
jgi:hypothetical protein